MHVQVKFHIPANLLHDIISVYLIVWTMAANPPKLQCNMIDQLKIQYFCKQKHMICLRGIPDSVIERPTDENGD